MTTLDNRERFEHARMAVLRNSIPLSDVTVEQARQIIRRYVAAIEGNFIAWMAASSVSARSVKAKYATDENLSVELVQNHPGMLQDFARSASAYPDATDFDYVSSSVTEIRNLVSELSGLKNITLMAALENTSLEFIPYLAELAKKAGGKDLVYTDVHGEADIEHADMFLEALAEERCMGYTDSDQDIDSTIESSLRLLNRVLCPLASVDSEGSVRSAAAVN